MGTDNYRYGQEPFEQMVAKQGAVLEDLKAFGEEIGRIVKDCLNEEGLVGTTGTALYEAFMRDVVKSMSVFNESAEENYNQNKAFQELMEENTTENTRIASSL